MRGAVAAAAQENFRLHQMFENRLQHVAGETQHLRMETEVI